MVLKYKYFPSFYYRVKILTQLSHDIQEAQYIFHKACLHDIGEKYH